MQQKSQKNVICGANYDRLFDGKKAAELSPLQQIKAE